MRRKYFPPLESRFPRSAVQELYTLLHSDLQRATHRSNPLAVDTYVLTANRAMARLAAPCTPVETAYSVQCGARKHRRTSHGAAAPPPQTRAKPLFFGQKPAAKNLF